MNPEPITKNMLFYGDNLNILRERISTTSIDLIYLDPPFNSSRNYNVLFKDEKGIESEAQNTAFEDTWHWDQKAEETYRDLVTQTPDHIAKMIDSLRIIVGTNQMMAYLVMMTARLIELHRVLKSTGSLYLHCDPTASHYLKIILDTIFGPKQFKNEIIWKRTSAHSDSVTCGNTHDILLFYTKSNSFTWNKQYQPYDESYIQSHYRSVNKDGRRYRTDNITAFGLSGGGYTYAWNGVTKLWRVPENKMRELDEQDRIHYTRNGGAEYIRYLDEMPGMPLQDVWDDIAPINAMSKERLGYPTQKPLALLERLIKASSNPGDLVLDPFCGCGTTVAAAQKLERRWIGIDIAILGITLQKYRLENMFSNIQFKIDGLPSDLAAAQALKQNPYNFQFWALSLIDAFPLGAQPGSKTGKKGSDKGIDGVITFIEDEKSGKSKRVIVQVKSGHVKPGDIRDLVGTIDREKAAIGVFITLENPTPEMKKEAVSAGYYHAPGWNRDYPRIQILTIADLIRHKVRVEMPLQYGTFKQAEKFVQNNVVQPEIFDMIE